jgi:hypothetical protein
MKCRAGFTYNDKTWVSKRKDCSYIVICMSCIPASEDVGDASELVPGNNLLFPKCIAYKYCVHEYNT